MATTEDSLYALTKALVCIVGKNQLVLREVEGMGGFQVGQSYTLLLFSIISVWVTGFTVIWGTSGSAHYIVGKD